MPSARTRLLSGAARIALGALALGLATTSAQADTAATAAAVERPSEVEAVLVTSLVKRSPISREVTSGVLGTRSALETPFSVESINSDEILARQVKDINGVFRNDAAVTQVNSGAGQASGASFRVRGLPLDNLNGYKIDGLAVPYWSIDFPVEHFDQIQLLKGATGFMYGFGGPGGIVNFVLKRPTEYRTFSLGAGYRSDSLYSANVDAGGRLAGGRVGYRFTGVTEQGDTYNGGHNRNASAALALDAALTDRLTWTVDAFYMKTRQEDEVNTVSVGAAVTHLQPVSGTTALGALGAWKTNEMNIFTTGLNWRFNDDWKANISYRHSKLDENYPGNLITITNNKGDYLNAAFFVQRVFRYDLVQATVEGKAQTGAVSHQLVFGAAKQLIKYDSDAKSLTTVPLGGGNLYTSGQPSLAAYPSSKYDPRPYLFNDYDQGSLFAADTLAWNRWSLLLGARYTIYRNVVYSPTGQVTAVYRNKPLTPTIALSYAIEPKTRLYVSYVEGLQNGGQAGTTNLNYPQAFGPILSTQVEAGIKTERSRWSGSLAAFRIEQDAGYSNAANYYVQDGKVRYQGVEATGTLRPASIWTVSGSVRYLDAKYLQTTASIVGKQVPGAARIQATLASAVTIPAVPGLSLDAQVKYTGEGYGNTTNTLKFPSYVTADIGASFATSVHSRPVVIRAAVKNITDERYWIYGSSTLFPGDPRSFAVSTNVKF